MLAKPHEPCTSRGYCYHSRAAQILNTKPEAQAWRVKGARITNGTWGKTSEAFAIRSRNGQASVESGRLELARTRAHILWNGSPRNIAALARARTPESIRKGGRIGGRLNGRKNVESGHLARIGRGVESTVDGILFKSQTEAMFYCVMKELGANPRYEPETVSFPDGTTYTPDFVLSVSVLGIPANVPIEVKPSRILLSLYTSTLVKARRIGAHIVYWNEFVE